LGSTHRWRMAPCGCSPCRRVKEAALSACSVCQNDRINARGWRT
jgi:hypothetical protein